MATFEYKAISASGRQVSGLLESDSKALAMEDLLSKGLHATDLNETDESALEQSSGAVSGSGRVSAVEMALFLRQMSTLINSDVPLVQTLSILERQMSNPTLCHIVSTVRHDVQGGDDLSKAMSKWPKAFSSLVLAMVRVGETGGVLGRILEELAGITERDQQVKSEVRAAMIYPIVVVGVGVCVVSFLMAFVVPKLTAVFTDMGILLPLATRMLLAISAGVRSSWWAMPIVAGAAFLAMKIWRASEEGRFQFDLMTLYLPLLGQVARKSSISRFSRALGVLLSGGVPLLEALQVVKDVLGNAALGQTIENASLGLTEGNTLASELEKSDLFPPLVTHMIGVGENSGNLDNMLLKIAETYEWQTQQTVKVLISLLMPVMILALAVVVGFIALALVLPLFSINEQFSG